MRDDTLAAAMVIRGLVDLGHRNIVVIGGNRDYVDIARIRYLGCMNAFREKGVFFGEEQYETARFTYEEGYRAAGALLQRNPECTALFAMSDVMAMGAVRALTDAGKRIPEDISVVGFDGLQIGAYTVPRLSTVAQSVEMLAERSVQLLRQQIEENAEARHEVIPVDLLMKESVRSLT